MDNTQEWVGFLTSRLDRVETDMPRLRLRAVIVPGSVIVGGLFGVLGGFEVWWAQATAGVLIGVVLIALGLLYGLYLFVKWLVMADKRDALVDLLGSIMAGRVTRPRWIHQGWSRIHRIGLDPSPGDGFLVWSDGYYAWRRGIDLLVDIDANPEELDVSRLDRDFDGLSEDQRAEFVRGVLDDDGDIDEGVKHWLDENYPDLVSRIGDEVALGDS